MEALLNGLVEAPLVLYAVEARPVCDIVIYGHREGVRLLKDHPDLTPQRDDVHFV